MTKQEADRIINDNYPKCSVEYLGESELSIPAGAHYYRIGKEVYTWVHTDGHIEEEESCKQHN